MKCSATSESNNLDKSDPKTEFSDTNRMHMVCAKCGSTDVGVDAFAAWDPQAGRWVLRSTYDAEFCVSCENDTKLLEIAEAAIEIQAFGMVNIKHGSRIAQINEIPEFFDVIVTTGVCNGEILALAEYESMTAEEASQILEDVCAAYPTAALNSLNCNLEGM